MTDTQKETPQKDIGTLRRHDLIVSVIMWVGSLLVLLESLRLTFGISLPGIEENVWLVAPGFLPMILSGGLLFMFSVMIWASLKKADIEGHFSPSAFIRAITHNETVTILIQMSLLCLFVFVFLGRLHFGIAATLYLFSAMAVARAAKLWQILLISTTFAGLVTFVFGTLMKIPLP